ncbi:MAG: UDP-N-acetylmuramoyl-tripeptide--D-alanyl-D-alanine ligase [Planctomycetaceae bacterium]
MQTVPLSTILAAVHGTAVGLRETGVMVQDIVIDSRQVQSGDLFVAVIGEHQDGHQYVAEALQRGAAAAVVNQVWAAAQARPQQLIVVEETLQALWDLAAWNRDQCDALRIGITGSVGKTTTRHMLQAVLSRRFEGMESPENFNNRFGVPLSLLAIKPEHEFAVIEAGASAVGEIRQLAALIEPEIGVVTSIGPAHLEGFGSLEEICRAKGELLEALPASGFAVLNGDDPLVRRLSRRASCRVVLVGEEIHNDIVASKVRVNDRRLRFQVGSTEYQLPVVGRHHLTAALLCLGVAREIDLTDSEIAAGLKSYTPVQGRCSRLTIGPWTVIDDTYNANPASMLAACLTLRDWQEATRRVLVVGDMAELGEHAEAFHQQLGEVAAECRFDRIIAVGEHAGSVADAARKLGVDAGCLGSCNDLDTAKLLLDCWLEPGDVILVKGSRRMGMEHVIAFLQSQVQSSESGTVEIRRKAA